MTADVHIAPLASPVAFELAAIAAEAILRQHSPLVVRKALVSAELGLPNALIQHLADCLGSNVKSAVLLRPPDLDLIEEVRKVLAGYPWMDPSVIHLAVGAALLADERRTEAQEKARILEEAGKNSGNLRKIASEYRRPRGILIPSGGGYDYIRFRGWYNIAGRDQAMNTGVRKLRFNEPSS
jgi:hypothetical protein